MTKRKEPSEKRKRGRPRKFKSAEQMQTAIDAYFAECDNRIIEVQTEDGQVIGINKPAPYTVCGLCLALDIDRDTLLNYEKHYEPEFFGTVKKAKLKVQQFAENHLYEGKAPTGAIFSLKCNYNWQDKQEVDVNHKGQVNITFGPKEEKL